MGIQGFSPGRARATAVPARMQTPPAAACTTGLMPRPLPEEIPLESRAEERHQQDGDEQHAHLSGRGSTLEVVYPEEDRKEDEDEQPRV